LSSSCVSIGSDPHTVLGFNLVPSSCFRLMDGFCEDPFVVVDDRCFGVLAFIFQLLGISVWWIGLDYFILYKTTIIRSKPC
jgi:hypothetical protein